MGENIDAGHVIHLTKQSMPHGQKSISKVSSFP